MSHPQPRVFIRKYKVLGDFGSKYARSRPTKDRGQDPANRNKFNSQQESNDIVNNTVDKISPQKYETVSDEK